MSQDADWVMQALRDDRDAFGTLVGMYQRRVFGLARHTLGSIEDAQDVSQETSLLAYQKRPSLRQPSKFASWLHTITMNLCKMWRRAARYTCVSILTWSEVVTGEVRRTSSRRMRAVASNRHIWLTKARKSARNSSSRCRRSSCLRTYQTSTGGVDQCVAVLCSRLPGCSCPSRTHST